MKSGFTKKVGKKEPQVFYAKQQGVAQAPTGHYMVSSGCFSLDSIIGGFPISSVILIAEDTLSEDYLAFIRLIMGEGVENSQQCIVVDTQDWAGMVPYSQKVTETAPSRPQKDEELNIAWRYRNLGESAAMPQTKYVFDLGKTGDKERIGKFYKLLKQTPAVPLTKTWESLIKSIQSCLGSPNDDKIFRLLFPNFLGPMAYSTEQGATLHEIAKFMLLLKHLVRSANGICVLSARKDMIPERIWNYLVTICDIVLEFKPFNNFAQKMGKYRGIMQITKLLYPNHIGEQPIATKTLGYVLSSKNLLVEKIEFEPEGEVAPSHPIC